jgi:hypothetical protein
MSRVFLWIAFALLLVRPLAGEPGDDGPPIAITSPDAGTTFAYGTIKSHSLFWNKSQKMLIARVVFTDAEQANGSSNDDLHEFRLPNVTLDEAKGIFSATTAKGVIIPVAHFKKVLFMNTIEVLPNAAVRVQHPRGVITVTLEAISPSDASLHPPAAETDPDGTHKVDINSIFR